jgi:hypothetical protein
MSGMSRFGEERNISGGAKVGRLFVRSYMPYVNVA